MTADIHLLSGAYALDAVDDALERRRFERHLAECAGCRDEVRALRETAAALAEAVAVRPSPELRARVLAGIATTPQVAPLPSASAARRRTPFVAAAAAAVLAGGALAGVGGVQLYRAEQADRQAAQVLAIAGDPAARRVTGNVRGGGTAMVVVSGARVAFIATDVPRLADDRTYQLWLVRPGEVRSAGLGPEGRAAGGRWSRLIEGLRPGDSVAISVEPPGGSRQPTTTPLAVLEV